MSAASSASAKAKPFLFDRSFDDPSKVYLPGEKFGPKVKVDLPKPKAKSGEGASTAASDTKGEDKPDEPPPPPPKTFSEAELEAAREEGYVEGHTTALEEAETAREHYVADALNLLAQNLDGLEDQQNEANREIGETALRLVYAVIEKVVPVHAQAHAVDSVEALVRDVLPLVYDEPTLVVRTHNLISDDVQTRLEEVCSRSNFSGAISVMADYELQPGDCRVEWQGGGADRNEARLWNDIRTIVADNLGSVDVDALDAAADVEAETAAQTAAQTAGQTMTTDLGPEEVVESQGQAAGEESAPATSSTADVRTEAHSEESVTGHADTEGADADINTADTVSSADEIKEEQDQEPGQPALEDSVRDQENDTETLGS